MTAEAHIARQVALQFEAKKHELRQLQDGHWKITLTIHPNDMPDEMMKAPMGTRYMIAAVEIGDDEAPVVKEKESRRWSELNPSQQSAMRCNEGGFQSFLRETTEFISIEDEHDAAEAVRKICHVGSRANLDSDRKAKDRWRDLDICYQAWLQT